MKILALVSSCQSNCLVQWMGKKDSPRWCFSSLLESFSDFSEFTWVLKDLGGWTHKIGTNGFVGTRETLDLTIIDCVQHFQLNNAFRELLQTPSAFLLFSLVIRCFIVVVRDRTFLFLSSRCCWGLDLQRTQRQCLHNMFLLHNHDSLHPKDIPGTIQEHWHSPLCDAWMTQQIWSKIRVFIWAQALLIIIFALKWNITNRCCAFYTGNIIFLWVKFMHINLTVTTLFILLFSFNKWSINT